MKAYRIVSRDDSQAAAEYLTENGQILLTMVGLIEGSRMAIDVLGRACIEALLQLSASGVAGEEQRGRATRLRTRKSPRPNGPTHWRSCPQNVEDFGKSMKPNKLGRQWRCFLFTPREGAIRHYMIFWRLRRKLTMNDKGGDFKGSMQHFT